MTPGAGDRTEAGGRRLIVNADDFGQSVGINAAIMRCHEAGIVTSASLMVRWPWAAAAAEYARANSALSVGLHVDLGEWICRDGEWQPLYEVVPTGDPAAVRAEIVRQFETFERLMGASPTHIDSHQHVHRSEPVHSIVADFSARLAVPYRQSGNQIRYDGAFYGQTADGCPLPDAISVDHLVAILRALPVGVTELGCHPGFGGDAPGMYVADRAEETRVLCDPAVSSAIEAEGIHLISFRDLAPGAPTQ
jgi:chitin disaccharide deacetylase